MLRHLKMEIRRQEERREEDVNLLLNIQRPQQPIEQTKLDNDSNQTASRDDQKGMETSQVKPPRRVRGRRSSKPMMEKRRRARINQCLDILKSYVLTDCSNLSRLGIDTLARENQDEETIARKILKSSGLINRHRGRKNPNKLEKADILELTVDYVRRLHEQRDQLLGRSSALKLDSKGLEVVVPNISELTPSSSSSLSSNSSSLNSSASSNCIRSSNVPISSPLSLNLNPSNSITSSSGYSTQTAPPSPPNSSGSSSPQPLLAISSNIIMMKKQQQPMLQQNVILDTYGGQSSGVLDLTTSDFKKRQQSYVSTAITNKQKINTISKPIVKDGVIMIEGADGCWRPWNLMNNFSIAS